MVRRQFLKAMLPVLLAATGTAPFASVAMAQGEGPESAVAVTDEWTAIGIGERIWYSFEYEGDESEIVVRMATTPKDSVRFSVWTPDNVMAWARGAGEHPVGSGAANSFFGGDQVWVGSFNAAGTYYVVVEQAGLVAGSYRLQITGSGVSYAAPAAAATQAAPAETTTTTAEAAGDSAPADELSAAGASALVATGGTGPADALTALGGWTTLAAGQRTWYAFGYDGGGSPIQVRMAVSVDGGADFGVWTADNIRDWVAGKPENPVGKGTVNAFLDDDLAWLGSFPSAGTYYVAVTSLTASTCQYKLQITGDGVTIGASE